MTVKVTSVESRRDPCTISGGEGIVIADTDEIRAKKTLSVKGKRGLVVQVP